MDRRELIAALLAGPFLRAQTVWSQPSDLTSLTIAQAAARLANREFTPLALTNAYLARIDRLNRDLNAYITVTRDLARREARNAKPGQKLYGIPIAHKDLFETSGVRTTAGSLLFEHHTPNTNAIIVQQLESMGAVLLGKTNTHELGGGVTTINPFFGTTRNPVDRTRIAGGSSGGSAAAVAAQLCAAATGSDTGGSVRIPAAFCGCVGFKPTHGRISTQGLIAASPTFDHVGFLTRTVEDAQILFRAVTGEEDSGLTNPIRVGLPSNYFADGISPELETAFGGAIARIGSLGARVTSVSLPIDDKTMARIFDPVFMFELWGRFGSDWRTNPGSFSKQFSAVFAFERPSVAEYEQALALLKEYQSAVDKLFDSVDVIATPTVLMTAPLITGPIDGMKILKNTWPFNAAGTPAISIPVRSAEARLVRRNSDGDGGNAKADLPVGLQLVGRRGEDDKLLQIARRFE
ncbi:MAG TPA: amidase [Vicinamibacterales bacterium]|nr:amidase [Vicinamibacterales bacterium]